MKNNFEMDKPTEYKCEKCQKTFDKKNQFENHLITCGNENYKCSICDNSFDNQKALGLHISIHKCDLCNIVFAEPNSKVIHMKNVHQEKKSKCDNCYKEFETNGQLQKHHSNVSDGSNNVRSSMFDRSKPKIWCSSSITIR